MSALLMPVVLAAQHTEYVVSFEVLWYVAEVAMTRSLRILAAVLVLAALVPTTFGRPNIICVESSGRVSYGCDDLVPDELAARLGVPASAGLSSQDCGFCHDFVVGQATAHSIHVLAAPIRAIDYHLLALVQDNFIASDLSFPVSIIDSSGNPPLKC